MMTKFKLLIDDGSHRQSDWLELFFDLSLAISIASLSHGLGHDFSSQTILRYIACFVPVWWIWNQFTFYSAHFNNGDWIFRAFMFSGVAGSLVMSSAFAHEHAASTTFILAYVILHIVLFCGWIRAYRNITEIRNYIRLKMTGIGLGVVIWSLALFVPDELRVWPLCFGVFLQLVLPIFAWTSVKNMITVHVRHITERHGLFTIIVLGECLISLSERIPESHSASAISNLILQFAIVVMIWWLYFEWDAHAVEMKGVFRSFTYNYGHFFLFCGLGLVSAGILISANSVVGIGFGLFIIALGALEYLTKHYA